MSLLFSPDESSSSGTGMGMVGVAQPEPRLDLGEPSTLGDVELGAHRGARDQDAGGGEQPADERDGDAEQPELLGVLRHEWCHVDRGRHGQDGGAQRGRAAGHEEATPVHLSVEEQVGDRRPQHDTRAEGDGQRPEPVEGQVADERPDEVEHQHLDQQDAQPERGEQPAADPGLLLVERRAVHRLHPPGERDPGEEEQQDAGDAQRTGRALGRREQLLHGSRRLAAQVELPDDHVGGGVALVVGGQGREQDQQRDQGGERLGRQHDAPVDPGHPDEAHDAPPQERALCALDECEQVL